MLSEAQLAAIAQLVKRFERLSKSQRRAHQEAEVRTNFIDPLFAAIGWPMDDRAHVERETTVVEGKRPDYIFKLHGVARLFLEAKPFREDARSLEYARDAISKAYNKGVPWAGVTNFTDLVIFDAYEEVGPRAEPRRVLDLTHRDYLRSDAGLHFLTREALEERSLDEQAQRTGIRRRAIPIEKRLYQSMRDWREKLFNDMARFLDWRSDEQLRDGDEAIQRLIDRLIFLRNCEDRGIRDPDLRALLHRIRDRNQRSVRVTDSLVRVFARAASTYDSEIFQTDALIDVFFRGLAGGTGLDETLAEVIEGLYSVPKSYAEYDFSQMEPDVLGQVYEQYLGYVPQRVRQLAAQQPLPGMPAQEIAIEAKRQRRKEHGIYYTPSWVVQYIVQNTVGRFLEDIRDRPDVIDNLTILDPACGSGSFLIRAYETLLEHHAAQMGGDIGHLDRALRERILRRNIYGVDLDPQAVEIARLNLLIRMVRQQELLPELRESIQLGNSLIEGDEASLRPFFADAWEAKHSFNWDQRFPRIMERGGFDVIIGNPPYVRIQTLPRDEVGYYNTKYEAATGSYDIYCLFVERGLQLLKTGGLLGFIIPNKFMQAQYGKGLRSLLADAKAVWKLVDFGDAQIFGSGTNYTSLVFLQKQPNEAVIYVPAMDALKADPSRPNLVQAEARGFSSQIDTRQPTWLFVPSREEDVMEKMRQVSTPLSEVCEKVFVGLQTSADDVYIMELLVEQDDGKVLARSRRNRQQYLLERPILKPLLSGHDIRRYQSPQARSVLLFPYLVESRKATLITPDNFSRTSPAVWNYLLENRERLESREGNKFKHDRWYEFGRSQNLGLHEEPKICVPRLVRRLFATYEDGGQFYLDNVDVNGILGVREPLYVLGLLNSQLINFYFQRITVPFHSGFRSANKQFIDPLPIRKVDGSKGAAVEMRDQIVTLVRRMLDVHQRLAVKGDIHDAEREHIEQEIAIADREIDDLVYDLYGLTAQERALIEAEVRR